MQSFRLENAMANDAERGYVSISYGDMQSFRPPPCYCLSQVLSFNLLRRYAVIPTPHRLTGQWWTVRFNLLRRYAVIPTNGPRLGPRPHIRFNLLRRYAVIPTCNTESMAGMISEFQSPTEICSHSDDSSIEEKRVRLTFQSPTEICSYSDISRSMSRAP